MSNHEYYIGIDNGTSGSIGILQGRTALMIKTPTKIEQSYTKTKKNISRIDMPVLIDFLSLHTIPHVSIALIERPMVNPTRFAATLSAMRALEATLIVLEKLLIAYMYVDSKEWQKMLLPPGLKGSPVLKKASGDIGSRLFPQMKDIIQKQKDADGLLIAEFGRRSNL